MTTSYHVHMDLEGFRELFVAQQRRYLKKIGIICTIFFVPMTPLAAYWTVGEPSPTSIGSTLLFAILAVLGIADIVKPPAMLVTRKPLVYTWFFVHGVEKPNEVPMAQLATDYDVEIGDYGFSEKSAACTLNTPWLSLREKPVKDTRGTYFTVNDGKESSALYNMIGINWALREETATGVLFIPNDVASANPQLVGQISQAITSMRQAVRGHAISAELAQAIQTWAGPRDPNDAATAPAPQQPEL